MNALWQMPVVVLVFFSWLSSPPAGLADVAQREALRRSATQKSTATLTNLGQMSEAVPPSAVTMPPTEIPPAGDAAAKPATAAKPPTPPDPPREETWWRAKMTELRTAVDRDTLAADALQSRINALKADAVNLDDPVKQARARNDLARALDELDKVRKQLETGQRAVTALQDEARRLNIPAGWIR